MRKIFLAIVLIALFARPYSVSSGTIPATPRHFAYLPIASKTVALYYTALDGYTPAMWRSSYPFDESGVPLVDYGGKIGKQYNPTTAAQYALALWNTGEPSDRAEFMRMAAYLRSAGSPVGDDAIAYRYAFSFEHYGLEPGWVSAISQGLVLSVLRRAYSEQPDPAIIDLARKVKNLMLMPVTAGGTYTMTPEGEVWLEEIPTPGRGNYGIDDFFSATIGLSDYTQLAPDDHDAAKMFQACLRSIERSVGFYDDDTWIIHDRRDRQRIGQNMLVIQRNEMRHLYEITGDNFYRQLSMKWAAYRPT